VWLVLPQDEQYGSFEKEISIILRNGQPIKESLCCIANLQQIKVLFPFNSDIQETLFNGCSGVSLHRIASR
jgi:hypothetical protein